MKKNIRNIGILAHIDAGKTTTSERILYYTGKIHKLGSVDDGTAELDYLEEEKQRGITIVSAATTVYWKEHEINLIDTPGHVDFTAEVKKAISVIDGAVIVVCGTAGVQAQTETIFNLVQEMEIPIIVFVNKLDRITSSFKRAFNSLKNNFKTKFVPLNIPVYDQNEQIIGVYDLIEEKGFIYDQDEDGSKYSTYNLEQLIKKNYFLKEQIEDYKRILIESIAEFDLNIFEKLVEDDNYNPFKEERDKSINLIRKLVINRDIIPVLSGSALKNKGIQFLLDAIINYFPSPDQRTFKLYDSTGNPVEKYDKGLKIAFCFKTTFDKQTGRISYIRVYKNNIIKGEKLYNSNSSSFEKIAHIYKTHANKREEIDKAYEGEIVAIIGFKKTKTSDTLLSIRKNYFMHNFIPSEPVISMKIEPEAVKDYKNLLDALAIIAEEDPSFFFKENKETGYIEVYGMGELHLEIIQHRLKNDFKINTRLTTPVISYRESIENEIGEVFSLKKDIKEKNVYAEVNMKLYPCEKNKIIINEELSEAIKSAFEEFKEYVFISGPEYGYPVFGVCVEIDNIKVEDAPVSVVIELLNRAYRDLFLKASPILLEPVMKIEIIVPVESFSDVYNDLIKKNAVVDEIEQLKENQNYKRLKAHGFLSEFFGYTTRLRTLTSGKGIFNMEFLKYAKKE